ncbi:cell surface protein [Companilactobacillus allii]|uniref:Cell surface protein n=1 Tax=Companilactobacillus allii TaxID=1847728 RepID=A0A1P8PZP4_9LACO|nr:glycerophosphodiester phosphodiesterase family protein [Companilactobacillus allii]APX71037.1 cell surface protein [Companilactobacillus allii]USQ68115.1 cell surface protein [Companilactobacillus allii]
MNPKNSILKVLLVCCVFFFASGFSVIGHRGDPIKAPEETFQSFDTAFSEGADYVELDLHVSKDNVLVVSHDKNLERVTGTADIVSQHNFSELSQLTQKNGEPIHSLDQVFEHYKNNPKAKFLIETKKTSKGNPQNMESLLKECIDKYNMQSRVMFHSFSTKSLQNEAELMPDIPRIFIAGTIKRVNFDVLSYVTGVNLSSKIITPEVINTLHYMGKSVYVWDEMNESPKKWNTLVNMPIDGVVTNYPATGNEYRKLKDKSKSKTLNQNVYYVNNKDEPIYENPYRLIKTDKVVHPMDGYHITNIIKFKGKEYVQLGENQFANSSGFTPDYELGEVGSYFGAKAIYRDQQPNNYLYKDPTSSKIIGRMSDNDSERIQSVKKSGSNVWLKVRNGWIKSQYVLIQLTDKNYYGNTSKLSYYNLPENQRYKNIDLLQNLEAWKMSDNAEDLNTDLLRDYPNSNLLFPMKIESDSINHI